MKVYSWNMLFRNKEQDRAFDFIKNADFDVFCPQEVPKEFLERLQTLPYHIAYAVDKERLFPKGTIWDYGVILSKHPITSKGSFSFPNYTKQLPFRTRLFVKAMLPFDFTFLGERNGLFVDINVPGFSKPIRIFNIHLILANPGWRLKEFEITMANHNASFDTVVCGDFNIIESRHSTILNWILGGRLLDSFFPARERTDIEKHFVSHEFSNPLRGKVTHPFSRSQLDHILVSHSLSVAHAEVLSDAVGSDHHPIFVELKR